MILHPIDVFQTSCGAIAPLELNVSGPGWAGNEQRVFESPFVLIGRHERSCLRLEDGEVSRQHAYLQQLGGRVFCVDLGSRTGIRWGGEPRPAGWLRPEQGVQIGPFTLELAKADRIGEGPGDGVAEDGDPLQDRVNDSQLLPRIIVEAGNKVLSRMHMNRALVLVGSSPACRLRLRDSRVAKYHCSLVRTPQGVWLINLLLEGGVRLNGQSLRWALVKEGDRLQVGPYVLRVWYPDGRTETPPPNLVAISAGTPVPPAEDAAASGPRPSQDQGSLGPVATEAPVLVSALQAEPDQVRERQQDGEVLRQQLADSQAECDRLRARVPELEGRANSADHLWTRLRNMGAEMERLRVQLRAAESQEAESGSVRAECDQLREQVHALEAQVAEAAGLQVRLEAAEANARERDRWQAEAQDLQAKLASDSVGQEQLDRLAADLHAAQVERDRLQSEQQTAQHSAEQTLARVSDLERALTEASAALEEARARWESERQALEARFELEGQSHGGAVQAHAAAEQEERQQFEAAQKQLVEEREAVCTASARLDQEPAILQRVQADLAARTAEHDAALRRLQEAQDELVFAQNEARGLQAELDQALERQRDIETLRQQLADAQAEHAQLRDRVPELEDRANAADLLGVRLRDTDAETERLRMQLRAAESQLAEAASLQVRLEAAEANARERDRWQAEARDLQTKLAANTAGQEQLDRLAADLHAAQAERDRLQSEQQTTQHSAEQALAQVSDLEQALTEASAALEEARARWESERQALEARLELEGQSHGGAVQAAVHDVTTQAAAEREEWRQRLEAAQKQLLWERGLFKVQCDQVRQQAVSLQAERDRLAAQLAHVEPHLRAMEARSRNEAGHSAASQDPRQQDVRDQLFVLLSSARLGHPLPHTARAQGPGAASEQVRPHAPLTHELASVEEQPHLTAIAQDIQVGEGEASAPADAAHDSAAPLGEEQPAEDAHDGLSAGEDSRSEARPRLWRRIFGIARDK